MSDSPLSELRALLRGNKLERVVWSEYSPPGLFIKRPLDIISVLIIILPILPDKLFPEAMSIVANICLQNQSLHAFLLKILATRLPSQGREELLRRTLIQQPSLIAHLSETLLTSTLAGVRAIDDGDSRHLPGVHVFYEKERSDLPVWLRERLDKLPTGKSCRIYAFLELGKRLDEPLKSAVLQEAVETAREISVPYERGYMLAESLPCLDEAVRNEVIQEILTIREIIAQEDEQNRTELLEKVIPYLSGPLWHKALAATRQGMEYWRGKACEVLVPHLQLELIEELFNSTLAITNKEFRIEVLAALLPRLPDSLLTKGLNELLAAAKASRDSKILPIALAATIPYLSGKSLQDAVAIARKCRDADIRAEGLIALLPYVTGDLKEKLLQEAVAAVIKIVHYRLSVYGLDEARKNTIGKLAPHLSQSLLHLMLTKISILPSRNRNFDGNEDERAEVLEALVPGLPAPLLGDALTATLGIKYAWRKKSVLEALIPRLSHALAEQVLLDAKEIEEGRLREDVLQMLAQYSPATLHEDILDATQEFKEEAWRERSVLEALAKYAPTTLLGRVLEAAQEIEEEEKRTRVFARVFERLPDSSPDRQRLLGKVNLDANPEHIRERVQQLMFQISADELFDFLLGLLHHFGLSWIETQEEAALPAMFRTLTLPEVSWSPIRPPQQRSVSTGFASYSQADTPLDPTTPLICNRPYYFWLKVGPPDAKSIEKTLSPLPIEYLPSQTRLTAALFAFDEEIQLTQGADVGELQLLDDGSVLVVHQPEHPKSMLSDSDLPKQCLFFPIHTPKKEGDFRLRCNIYYEQILVQSRLITARVLTEQHASRINTTTKSTTRGFHSGEQVLRSDLDYTLSHTLTPTHLTRIAPYQLSLMLDSNDHDVCHFRILGKDGKDVFKLDTSSSEQKLKSEIRDMRDILHRITWNRDKKREEDWEYLYDKPPTKEQLKYDLLRLAIKGYRFHHRLTLAPKPQVDRLRDLIREPILIQIALKSTLDYTPPSALIYDYPLNTGYYPDYIDQYKLCEEFSKALENAIPLEEIKCFKGQCPSWSDESVICPSGFWGYRHYMSMPLSEGSMDVSPSIIFQQRPNLTVGVSTDPMFKERQQHEERLRLFRSDLKWNYAFKRQQILDLLKETNPHLIYFYCHGGVSSTIPYIEVGYKEPPITPDQLSHISWSVTRPLVFINGCRTGTLEVDQALDFVSTLVIRAEASGVIGTEISIAEPLACTFAEEFFHRFLAGMPLGEAVRSARLRLLEKGNPLGLIYTPFAMGSLHLTKE